MTLTLSLLALLTSLQASFALGASVPENAEFDFSGQVSLGNCSGSVVRYTDNDSAKAVVLTNGHCLDMMGSEPNAVVVNQPMRRDYRAFVDRTRMVTVQTTRILYGIMQPHDLALVELDSTYAELEAQGIKARGIQPVPAKVGDQVILASGLFKSVQECNVEGIIHRIREDKWTNHDSYKYRKCISIHGTSGSPLINSATGLVVGVNYTHNDDGEECTFNNPCEIDEHGNIKVDQGASYGDQIHKILTCVDRSGKFDSTLSRCDLPRGTRLRASRVAKRRVASKPCLPHVRTLPRGWNRLSFAGIRRLNSRLAGCENVTKKAKRD